MPVTFYGNIFGVQLEGIMRQFFEVDSSCNRVF